MIFAGVCHYQVIKPFLRAFHILHALMAALYALAALALIAVATKMGVSAFADGVDHASAQHIIEAMGILAAAVVALQIAQTITEEEVVRGAMSVARRVSGDSCPDAWWWWWSHWPLKGWLPRSAPPMRTAQLLHAAALVLSIGVLLAGWGVFIRLNRAAEELEPEAMQEAKREDEKLQ